jgi:hypothetical protein
MSNILLRLLCCVDFCILHVTPRTQNNSIPKTVQRSGFSQQQNQRPTLETQQSSGTPAIRVPLKSIPPSAEFSNHGGNRQMSIIPNINCSPVRPSPLPITTSPTRPNSNKATFLAIDRHARQWYISSFSNLFIDEPFLLTEDPHHVKDRNTAQSLHDCQIRNTMRALLPLCFYDHVHVHIEHFLFNYACILGYKNSLIYPR